MHHKNVFGKSHIDTTKRNKHCYLNAAYLFNPHDWHDVKYHADYGCYVNITSMQTHNMTHISKVLF